MSTKLSLRAGLSALALVALAGQASAQSIYIDLGDAKGAPSSTFGAAAGIAGTWNQIGGSTPSVSSLVNTAGGATTSQLIRAVGTTLLSVNNAAVTGNNEALLEDSETIASAPLTYTISNLTAGDYLVYVYGGNANNSASTYNTQIVSALGQSSQNNGGSNLASNNWKPGLTHSVFLRKLPFAGSIQIQVGGVFGISAQCAGIQIVKLVGRDSGLPHVFYVNDNATGDRDGNSWTDAMTDLQDGLESARRIGGANAQVWVASGTYKPTSGTDRSVSFDVPSGLGLYGGFAGTEAFLNARTNPAANPTILSGAIGAAGDTDNSRTVVDLSNAAAGTLMDGFTVTKGYNAVGGTDNGGGLLMTDSFAQVQGTTFNANFAQGKGGAVFIHGGGPKFAKCTFTLNSTNGYGGAVFGEDDSVRPEFHNSMFVANSAGITGGAIATQRAAIVTMNSVFNNNSTSGLRGGALFIEGNGANSEVAWIVNSTLVNNDALTTGAAAYATKKATISFWNSIAWNNNASAAVLLDKEVAANTADGSSIFYSNSTVRGRSGTNGADPLFVDADGPDNLAGNLDDNFRLGAGSPAIDDGFDANILNDSADLDGDGDTFEVIMIDMDGKPRQSDVTGIADGVNAGSPPVDRGAYETKMKDCLADIDDSTEVDFGDFLAFFNAYDTSGSDADLDLSGEVDFGDFLLFFNSYDTGCL